MGTSGSRHVAIVRIFTNLKGKLTTLLLLIVQLCVHESRLETQQSQAPMTEERQNPHRPRAKLLGIVSGFVVGLVLVGAIGLNKIEQHAKAQIQNSLQTILRSTHKSFYFWLEHRFNVLKSLTQSDELVSLTQAQLSYSRDPQTLKSTPELSLLRDFFIPVLQDFEDLGMLIIAPDLTTIASMRNANIGQTNPIALQQPEIMKDVFNGEPRFILPISSEAALKSDRGRIVLSQPSLFLATPIQNREGDVIAVLILRLDPQKDFSQLMQLGRAGRSGETYAIDKTGVLLSESRFDDQLRNMGHLKPDESSILTIRVSDPGSELIRGQQPRTLPEKQPLTYMAQQVTSGNSGVNTQGYRDYRGIEVYGAWIWDDKLGFGMTTQVDVSEADQAYEATRLVLLSLFVFTLLLTTLLLLLLELLSRSNRRDLQNLHRRMEHRIRERTLELEEVKVKLSTANRELQELATADSLTGLSNRRHLEEFLESEWSRCLRDKKPIAFILFDIDYFKLYNDHYGHLAGDECLQQIGQILQTDRFISRPGDLLARYGGEEFAIVLSGTALADAQLILIRLFTAIDNAGMDHMGTQVTNTNKVTISAGLSCMVPTRTAQPSHLINLAGEALNKAKSSGRNQYQIASTQELKDQDVG